VLQTLFEQVSQSVLGEPEILVAGMRIALHLGQRLTVVIVCSGSIVVFVDSDSDLDLDSGLDSKFAVESKIGLASGLSRYF
jgi:hypothetical protein